MSANQQATVSFRTKTYRASIIRPSNATAYTDGDAVSAETTNDMFVFGAASSDISKVPGRGGYLTGALNTVILRSSANQTTKLKAELWLFQSIITKTADNAAFSPSDDEVLKCVGVIDIPDTAWKTSNAGLGAAGSSIVLINNIDQPIHAAGNGMIYGQLVAKNAYGPVSGEIITCDLVWTQD